MKKVLQSAFLPLVIFTSGMLLLGCDQAQEHTTEQEETQTTDQNTYQADESEQKTHAEEKTDLKSGNMFYMVRDAANLQLQAGDYVEQLKDTQLDVEQAIQDKNQHELKTAVSTLKQQLQGLNQTLLNLDLKSQEIESIRQSLLHANQQALGLPVFNGQLDQINFDQIEKQLNTIQMDMVKLAAMIMASDEKSDTKSDS